MLSASDKRNLSNKLTLLSLYNGDTPLKKKISRKIDYMEDFSCFYRNMAFYVRVAPSDPNYFVEKISLVKGKQVIDISDGTFNEFRQSILEMDKVTLHVSILNFDFVNLIHNILNHEGTGDACRIKFNN